MMCLVVGRETQATIINSAELQLHNTMTLASLVAMVVMAPLCIHSFILSFIHSFIHSFIRS